MPDQPPEKPEDRPEDAAKKPRGPAKAKIGGREVRLAGALRANLRRRKVGATDKKDD